MEKKNLIRIIFIWVLVNVNSTFSAQIDMKVKESVVIEPSQPIVMLAKAAKLMFAEIMSWHESYLSSKETEDLKIYIKELKSYLSLKNSKEIPKEDLEILKIMQEMIKKNYDLLSHESIQGLAFAEPFINKFPNTFFETLRLFNTLEHGKSAFNNIVIQVISEKNSHIDEEITLPRDTALNIFKFGIPWLYRQKNKNKLSEKEIDELWNIFSPRILTTMTITIPNKLQDAYNDAKILIKENDLGFLANHFKLFYLTITFYQKIIKKLVDGTKLKIIFTNS